MKNLIATSLALIVILGGVYFYQTQRYTIGAKSKDENGPQATSSAPQKSIYDREGAEGTPANVSDENERKDFAAGIFPSMDFLSSLFKPRLNFLNDSGLTFPFGEKGNNATGNQNAPVPSSPPSPEKQGAIRSYLIASSDLFPQSLAGDFLKGLGDAFIGDATTLTQLQGSYRERLEQLKTLTPPEELTEVHTKSVEIVEDFISVLGSMITEIANTPKDTWNQEKLKEIETYFSIITQSSKKTREEIITIVKTYNIHLPQGVILE